MWSSWQLSLKRWRPALTATLGCRYYISCSVPQLEIDDMNNVSFETNGATCHAARKLLYEIFSGSVISPNGEIKLPL